MGSKDRELDFNEREIVLRADFGDLDDRGYIQASLRFIMQGPRHPVAGEWVYLLDSRGRGCLGRVESIDGWTAQIKPDWDSWAGSAEPPAPLGPTA